MEKLIYMHRIAKISCTLPVKKFNDVVFLKYFDCEDAFATIYVTLIKHGTVTMFYSSIELLYPNTISNISCECFLRYNKERWEKGNNDFALLLMYI